MKKEYLIYDARYNFDPDKAIVMVVCNGLGDGLEELENSQQGSVLVELEGEKETIIKVKS